MKLIRSQLRAPWQADLDQALLEVWIFVTRAVMAQVEFFGQLYGVTDPVPQLFNTWLFRHIIVL